ncbi:MAG: VOC family protein [Rhodospirillales bacterium]|nr:MAG: VOC family protein [Rhodospirillales bacterium]
MTDKAADPPMLTGAAAVFVVRDIAAARDHYRDALGFDITFEWGAPLRYVCLCRDEVQLHLLSAAGTRQSPGQGGLCVFVRDVDAVHAGLAARGARVVKPPATYDYGMRDFDVLDPDGNRITFGMAAAPAAG